MLTALGNPEKLLPCVVHVAGTNGKGSTLAFLKAICEAAGLTVHCYTSPHLVHFNERISVAGKDLDDDALNAVLDDCEAANAGGEITFFEMTTAAAFLAFSRVPADVTLIETGLGGRFDATNVFAKPALTIITPVSMDHMSWLGDTLEQIAFEKAGILKPGVPSVIGPQIPDGLAVIERRAAEIDSPLLMSGRDWQVRTISTGFQLEDGEDVTSFPHPALSGPHQYVNAATAVIAARRLTALQLDPDAIAKGLATASWPGRMQDLTATALGARLPAGWSLTLDGGHNVAAAEALATIAQGGGDTPLHLVFGALSSRDPTEFLRLLAPYVAGLQAVAIPGEETALSAEDCCAAARLVGIQADIAGSITGALDSIADSSAKSTTGTDGKPGRVLICGSLYLAGAVLADIEKKAPPKGGAS
ncbi:MAG: dihydrofolate synthase/folylpolyglutamate synthase [Alphaproteobacteria bacterium]